MKKLSCFIVGLLLLSGFATLSLGEKAAEEIINLRFSCIVKNAEIAVEGANALLYLPGKPVLPIYHTTFSLPFGTRIVDIECKIQDVKSLVLPDKITLAPYPVAQGKKIAPLIDKSIYDSESLFPDSWFCYYTSGGLDENNERKTFITLRVYPVRYNPAKDTLYYVENLHLKIIYEEPTDDPFPETNTYDLVVIAPSVFAGELQRLIDHKNSHGLNTVLKTLDEIYGEYNGVDKPEQIKYFIKDAIETLGIKYVLLVGGMKSLLWGRSRDDVNQGTRDWYLPVRYTNLRERGTTYDPGFISDLYYADIYDSEGEFSSWDSDGDGVFAKWRGFLKNDVIDLYPDVYVGRLACRNKYEVKIMVDKIIEYESTPANPSWFNKMVLVAGDTHDDPGTDYVEGELIGDYILENYMTGFDPVKLYASNRDIDPGFTPSSENIIREISAGCGHLLFTGHGNPGSWNTHWVGYFGWDDSPGGIHCYEFPDLSNGYKLPVCIVEGCHNSQFNITFFATLLEKPFMWTYGVAFPECWSWWLTRKIGGGSIATIGHTGLSYEAVGETGDIDGDGVNLPDVLEVYCGYQNLQFYKTYYEGKDVLGEVWGGTLKKYLDAHPGMSAQGHAKTVEQWVLLGDPSLKIGGYTR